MSYDLRDQRGRLRRLSVPEVPGWKALGKARQSYMGAVEKLRTLGVEHERLRLELAAAEEADLRQLGVALAADREPPAETAPKIKAKLDDTFRRMQALELEIERLAEIVVDTVEQNRASWTADAAKAEAEAARDYLAAIGALEQARLRLSERQNVRHWVSTWPEFRGELNPGTLGSLRTLQGLNGEPMPLGAVLDALRAELDPPKPTTVRGATHVAAVA